ncbi:MAG: SH3 domain-containing protein [Synergistaceae bacterium]|nr:SH3 domain-containing protein [Synergistaceae bacterium]
MRKLLAAVLLGSVILCGIAEAAVFTSFPADGICTGDYVRYRARPGTNSKILGRLFEGDEVTVLSEVRVKSQRWYEIYDPNASGRTVWVAGQYIAPIEY